MAENKFPSINPNLSNRKKREDKSLNAEALFKGIAQSDRVSLGRAITLIESHLPAHKTQANKLLESCLSLGKSAIRIGITGTPGVGKSTFIEAYGQFLIEQGHRVAILAIDPSSSVSGGSILGDKTRMEKLSNREEAFIRPSPAGDSLGGVARKTRETILLCEAAGFDRILIETVGVGQSETAVHSMVDFFMLLLLPGAGDELQGIKRGIVEMADLFVVNKSDGDRVALAKQTRRSYRNALHLFPPKENGWTPSIVSCSALEGSGIEELNLLLEDYIHQASDSGYLSSNRKKQAQYWFNERIQEQLLSRFEQDPMVAKWLPEYLLKIDTLKTTPFIAADQLIRKFLNHDDRNEH